MIPRSAASARPGSPLPREVARTAIANLGDAVRRAGLNGDDLFAGTGLDPARLPAWVSWDAYCDVLEACERVAGSPEAAEAIWVEVPEVHELRVRRHLLGLVLTPAALLRFVNRWIGPMQHPLLETEYVEHSGGRSTLRITIPPSQRDCPAFFRSVAGAVRATPRAVEQPDAEVELRLRPRAAEMLIVVPVRPSLRGRLQHAWAVLRAGRDKYHDGYAQALGHLVSSRARLNDLLQESREGRAKAEDAARRRAESLETLGHDVLVPLQAVVGATAILLRTSLDPTQREYSETIQESALAMTNLVRRARDMARVERGTFELEEHDLDLRAVLEGVLRLLREPARQRGNELSARVADDVPVALRGDPDRLRQVLLNLVNNAVRFTQNGRIEVQLTCEGRRAEGGDQAGGDADHDGQGDADHDGQGDADHDGQEEDRVLLRFEVVDTGIGLSDDTRLRLFRPYEQADRSTSRRYGGTGLGLAIAKELVACMGGEIGVESAGPGASAGALFWFTARLRRAQGSDSAPGAEGHVPESQAGPRRSEAHGSGTGFSPARPEPAASDGRRGAGARAEPPAG